MSTKIVLAGHSNSIISTAFDALKDRLAGFGWQVVLPCEVIQPQTDTDKILVVYQFDEAAKVPERSSERDCFEGAFVLVEGEEVHNSGRPAVRDWVGHPHLRVVDVSDTFDMLLAQVLSLLGIPQPVEIERKFLIKMPRPELLSSLSECRGVKMSQTYIILPDGTRARIRRRGEGEDCTYIKTVKKKLTDRTRIEIEEPLTAEEYRELLKFADPLRRTVEKTRYCFVWSNTYFELDIFPFWDRQAFVELELLSEEQEFSLPPFLEVIREVTDDPNYNNSSLAMSVPKQD